MPARTPLRRPRPEHRHYTYADYEKWPESMRCEIIYGEIYMMSAPSMPHQDILGGIYRKFADFLDDKPCKVYLAPVDVRITADPNRNEDEWKKDDLIVQPDMIVVCDKKKRQHKACIGAPDLVLEVLSDSNRKHDQKTKLQIYLENGVREYWIADPEKRTIATGIRHEGDTPDEPPYYEWQTWGADENAQAPAGIFDGALQIDVAAVFAQVEE
jgi:Uma2 family endonuclease